MKSIIYKNNISKRTDILSHLLRTDTVFLNNLKKKVNLEEYSLKLASKAKRFEAWNDSGQLIGIVCIYLDKNSGFISNVSVEPRYYRLGIGNTLIKKTILLCKSKSIKNIKLEVEINNKSAIQLYVKNGFKIKKTLQYNYLMDLKIK